MRSQAYIQGFYDKIAGEDYGRNRSVDSTTLGQHTTKTKSPPTRPLTSKYQANDQSQPPGAAVGGDTTTLSKGNVSGEDRTIQTYNSVAPAIGRGDP